jgi:diphosphomevalonate decarboxylase
MKTQTTVFSSETLTEDEIYLNDKREDIMNPRLQTVLAEVRRRATNGNEHHKVRIVSKNNFPTAAGLASSASGYCCLVFALAQLYGVEGDVSSIARVGSGSACRSMFGGFVKWDMGTRADGSDSMAVQVAPETHWPEMEVLILVVNDNRKETSSTEGMQQTANTCDMMEYRVKQIVPRRMVQMEQAILNRDYETFADITMRDSDDFHAVCAATQPPIYYMNDISRRVVRVIHEYNMLSGHKKCAYTFDAGPNACLYLPRANVVEVLALIQTHFPPSDVSGYFRGDQNVLQEAIQYRLPPHLQRLQKSDATNDALKYIIHTKIGPGPQVLSAPTEHLVDPLTGSPRAI